MALAESQSELGIIPAEAAAQIAAGARVEHLDQRLIEEVTTSSSHSTLGLIAALREALPAEAAEWVYYGATVQDLTDTWMVLQLRDVGSVVWRDLSRLEDGVIQLATAHRSTPMAGRTHGQPGAPTTFGLKAASWADEIGRHLERLADVRDRLLVGQLGGAVGTLGFFGETGPALRAAFCARLGLGDPGIAWLTSRDRFAEFGVLLAMITGTLARIGNEVLELQRPEIGELAEPTTAGTVGSITMPHKRNPERSEHLDTLARICRAQAGILLEGMNQLHERDGRGWKAEWVAIPELCLCASSALLLAVEVIDGLEVRSVAMRANIDARSGALASERVVAALSQRYGKHRARELLHDALGAADEGSGLAEVVARAGLLEEHEVRALVAQQATPTATATAAVDAVVASARERRAGQGAHWP